MHRRHILVGLSLAGLSLFAGRHEARVTAGWIVVGGHDLDEGAKDCERVTTTGRATVRRRCDGTRVEASVNHHIDVRDPRVVRPTHERPVDRVRARGEGRIHATGDKGARRELREKMRRGR